MKESRYPILTCQANSWTFKLPDPMLVAGRDKPRRVPQFHPLGRNGSPMVAVKRDDLSLAFEVVGAGAPCENKAYISLDTGEIFWTSELNPMDEDVPELLDSKGALDRWYAYEAESIEQALRAWCAENGLEAQ